MALDSNCHSPTHEVETQTETPRCDRGEVLLLDRICRELERGDHIYTWSSTEIHHGIYVGDGKVIYYKCRNKKKLRAIVSSSMKEFLSGGKLYVFEYNVNRPLFLAKPGGNFYTTASADPTENVLHRARFLLENSSADYHPYIKNCYDFAIYCKTGSIMYTERNVVRNDIVAPTLAATVSVFFFLLRLMPDSFTALAATGLGIYSTFRLALDIGSHPYLIKVEVERFAEVESLASHSLGRTVLFLFEVVGIAFICALISLSLSMWSMTRPLVWVVAGFKFLYWLLYTRTFEFRWVFSNQLRRKQPKCGDHIYTWRNWYSYAHHGIYVGEGKVIHLTRREGPIISSSSPQYNPISGDGNQSIHDGTDDRVEKCSMDTFLSGGKIYVYDYDVGLQYFIAKSRGGTCTLAHSDPQEFVLRRANNLCKKNFGGYNLFSNNCEDFALYCKTGLLVPTIIALGRSGQTASTFALICAVITFPYSLLTSNFVGVAALGYVLYSIWRLFSDTGYRWDARKVAVEELAAYQKSFLFKFQQLFFSLPPKILCYAILIRTYFSPGAPWTIRRQNYLLDWIIILAYLWVVLF